MKILVAIVHYWNPKGGGEHESLRPDPSPRINALQSQLLSLLRCSSNQSVLHMKDRAIYRANNAYRHDITLSIITDGCHHVLDLIDPSFASVFNHIKTQPVNSKLLGFEAQKYLASHVSSDFDLLCYLEDDLIIHDPLLFDKAQWFSNFFGNESILLPHRYEVVSTPHIVDRLYIDGPISDADLRQVIPHSPPVQLIDWYGQTVPFSSPENPHSGCFFLNSKQFSLWTSSDVWQDNDISFISPLESAATLGISKVFKLFKPSLSHAAFFQLQHYGSSFHSLINA